MPSLAATIPQELFDFILFFVVDEQRLWYSLADPEARRQEMHYLSACALTCTFWARSVRERMYKRLVLRSFDDLRGLQDLLHASLSGPTRILPIGTYLEWLIVHYKLVDYPWFHSAQRLRVNGAPSLSWLEVHVSGPVPAAFTSDSRRAVLHPLFYCAPRVLPMPSSKDFNIHITVENIHFANSMSLSNLLRDLVPLEPFEVSCNNLTWDDGRAASREVTLPPHVDAIACGTETPVTTVAQCTDNVLVAFMVRSRIRRSTLSTKQITSAAFVHEGDTSHLYSVMRMWYDYWAANYKVLEDFEIDLWSGTSGQLWQQANPDSILGAHSYFIASNMFTFFMRPQFGAGHYVCSFVIELDAEFSTFDEAFKATLRRFTWGILIDTIRRFPSLTCIVIQSQNYEDLGEFVNRLKRIFSEVSDLLRLYYRDDTDGNWCEITFEGLLKREKRRRKVHFPGA